MTQSQKNQYGTIRKKFEENNYILLDNHYINKDQKLTFKDIDNYKYFLSYHSFCLTMKKIKNVIHFQNLINIHIII